MGKKVFYRQKRSFFFLMWKTCKYLLLIVWEKLSCNKIHPILMDLCIRTIAVLRNRVSRLEILLRCIFKQNINQLAKNESFWSWFSLQIHPEDQSKRRSCTFLCISINNCYIFASSQIFIFAEKSFFLAKFLNFSSDGLVLLQSKLSLVE